MDNRFNKVFSSFNPLNTEFSPGFHFIDVISSHFSFHSFIKCSNNNLEDCSNQLNNITIMSLLNHLHALIISNAGIKNNIATSITHIHIHNRSIVKTIHYVANVTSTDAKLFAIRCGINQAIYWGFQKLSLSQTLSMLQRRYLIQQSTYTQLPFLRNSGNFSSLIATTQLPFGNALANMIGLYSNL